jgi:hypothetical protein
MAARNGSAAFKKTVLNLIEELTVAHGDLILNRRGSADTMYLEPKFYHSITFQIVYRETASGRGSFHVYLLTKKGKGEERSQAIARIENSYEAARFVTAADALFAIRAGRHGITEGSDSGDE